MASASGNGTPPLKPGDSPETAPPQTAAAEAAARPLTVERLLMEGDGACSFDFFQAVRLMSLLGRPNRELVGADGPTRKEIARFLAHLSLSFPASSIQQLVPGSGDQPAQMTVNFMGLTGPSGVLPRHYTERLWNASRGLERTALQDWFDLFNHRFISLFYRAWEKYRFYIPYERGESVGRDLDPFSRCLFSMIGMGFRSHRNRFRVVHTEIRPAEYTADEEHDGPSRPLLREKELAKLEDLSLLRFAGIFAHRPRSAVSLELFLQVYLQLPVKVVQFQGQWVQLDSDSQTTMGTMNHSLGANTLVGDRIWDVQSKVRIRLGPLSYEQFLELLPDRTPRARRKRIFLVAQIVRQYLGAEMDVEFQLILQKKHVPGTQSGPHSRLGWNTWSKLQPYPRDAEDTVFTVPDGINLDAPS